MLKIHKNLHLLVRNLEAIEDTTNKKFGKRAKSDAAELKKFLTNKNAIGMGSRRELISIFEKNTFIITQLKSHLYIFTHPKTNFHRKVKI